MPDEEIVEKNITSTAAMQSLAAQVTEQLQAGDVVLLYGELGAGKTTFVQGVAQALGVTEPTTSPTFTIVSEYATTHFAIPRLIHTDFYRLSLETAAQDPAVRDLVPEKNRHDALLLIEWADRINWPSDNRVFSIHFTHGRAINERWVTLDRALLPTAS